MIKSFRVIGITSAFLLLGWTVPASARQDQQDKSKGHGESQHQQQKPQQETKAPQQQASRPQQQAGASHQEQQKAPQQQARTSQQQQQVKPQQNQPQQKDQQQHQAQNNQSAQHRSSVQVHQQQVAWQSDRAHDWKSDHRTWQQRGGYSGYRVPDARFNAYYGQDHGFRIMSLPVVFVGGQQRFNYGGYWFGFVDPWPEYWSNSWYDDDDVYVDYYDGGYYLYNRSYPGDRIAVSFYLN